MDRNENGGDVTGVFSALSLGFQLNRKQQGLVLRILWVLVVTLHIAWACGWLSMLGLAGFAKAEDVGRLQKTLDASARVTLSQEIRAQARLRCTTTDQGIADAITRYIDSLQDEYQHITGQHYPEPQCPPR